MIFTPNSEKNKRNSKLIQIIKCNKKTELFKYKFYNFRRSFSPMDYADASMENLYRFFYFTNTSCILVDNLNISVCLTVSVPV